MTGYRRSVAKDSLLGAKSENLIQRALKTIRRHLGMEVAYFSQIVDDCAILRRVDAPGLEHMVKVGDVYPMKDIYCGHVLAGRLPELMADTSMEPIAAAMPITSELPVGTNISIPIKLSDGRTYGMFCALSRMPQKNLNQRDLEIMRVFADLVAEQVNDEVALQLNRQERVERIRDIVDESSFNIVYQPIWNFSLSEPVGFEALCRFTTKPIRSPDVWFKEAESVGMGLELEIAAIEEAIKGLQDLPQNAYLTLNASPDSLLDGGLEQILENQPVERLVVEMTEHAPVEDYATLRNALKPLRERGLRLAIDDAGAGFASLQHIIQLTPDIIKIDMSLTRDVHMDAARRALAAALIYFGQETNATILAEGIETIEELETLKALGISGGQGYLLGKPAPLAEALAFAASAPVPAAKSARRARKTG